MLDVDGWAFSSTPQVATVEELKGVIDWDRARGMEVTDAKLAPVGTLVACHSSLPTRCAFPAAARSRPLASRGLACTPATAGAAC